ncbi:hypothetical protein EVAR_17735_1 [Eumeta japonica]|uniref:Uncharacterized protein n=1 Tax=Eumeta variegata TaxID=151549 RepID=A0A4C1TTB4_EUMVA|nr:hypothetical protein EVAR_17735_1 [Eumeta japonica]
MSALICSGSEYASSREEIAHSFGQFLEEVNSAPRDALCASPPIKGLHYIQTYTQNFLLALDRLRLKYDRLIGDNENRTGGHISIGMALRRPKAGD